jgi:surface protein
MFNICTDLTSLNVSNFDTSKVTKIYGMFRKCKSLTSLDCSSFDIGKITSSQETAGMFIGCESLTNLQAPKNISGTLMLYDSPNLTHDSLMSVINNLKNVGYSRELILGATNLAKLTAEEIAIATNKGWIVSAN